MIPARLSLLGTVVLFAVVATGLAWPWVARRTLAPAEKLLATLALSLLGSFLLGWTRFVAQLPPALYWMLPLLAVAGLVWRRRELAALWRDPSARDLIVGQAIVTIWCLGWLASIATYSGGGWAADWFEHWERTCHFLARGEPETLFIEHASLTARPPLANVVIAALLALTRVDFAHYQLCSTLLGSLAFSPAALLARRWGGPAAIPITAVLFLLNPMFVQNATFAWTKLPCTFFVLVGVWFFLRATDGGPPRGPALLCAASLAAAILTHYSAGPVALVLAAAWIFLGMRRRADIAWRQATAGAVVLGALLLGTWFGWAVVTYGVGGTLFANTSVQAADSSLFRQFGRIALNLRDTLVPHFLRPLDTTLIAQTSPWGAWRDWCFQLYQTNLLFAFGSLAWIVFALVVRRCWLTTPAPVRFAWAGAVGAVVVLGVAVHGARDTWGLAHICLQPVVFFGLAVLAAKAAGAPRHWRLLLAAGAVLDLALGLVLHFGVQNLTWDRWFRPGRSFDAIFAEYSPTAFMNVAAKVQHQLAFVSDVAAIPLPLLGGGLAACLAVALWRVRQRRAGGIRPT